MKTTFRHCLFAIIAAGLLAFAAHGQETFHNPAFETDDEFGKAFAQARRLLQQGKVDDAIKEFSRAAQLKNNQCVECFTSIGQADLQLNKYKEAAAAFRRGAELGSPQQAELYNYAGVALYLADEKPLFAEAAAMFKRAIETGDGKIAQAYYNLGYALIKAGKTEEGTAALKTYLEKSPNAPEAEAVKAVIGNPKLVSEQFAMPFKATSAAGDELSLDKLKGKVVLLDFWASWCGPCRAEMPAVKRIWQKYQKENFVLIGINLDDNRKAFEQYVKEEGLAWPQVYERGGGSRIAQLYSVNGIPMTFLIDQQGIVRAQGLRGERLYNKIADLLKEKQKQ
ncbi:MAG TPA: redoxin domain-containing protein [Blastocatellia bacterium]|nr:redoxin domain-containing protein [Blastocatellia bacterium]